MPSCNRFLSIVWASLCLLAIAPAAHGYIDAGAGSYLLQIALAGILGASFMARTFIASIKLKFSRKQHDADGA
jgi:hypothetical protein